MQFVAYLTLMFTFFCFSNLVSQLEDGINTLEIKKTTQSSKNRYTWPEIIDYAKAHLPQKGKLMRNPDGYVYLKVDDDYIHRLFPMLGLRNYHEPPYFRNPRSPGAHISVIYSTEHVVPEEVGHNFHFDLKKIVIVKPSYNTWYAILEGR